MKQTNIVLCPICAVFYFDTPLCRALHEKSFDHRAAEVVVAVEKLLHPNTSIPEFNSVTSCPKCNKYFKEFGTSGRPNVVYIEKRNVIKRWCHNCSYSWVERCADGSEPIEE